MGLLSDMTIRINGDMSGLNSTFSAARGVVGGFSSIAIGALAAVGGAAVGVGIATVKMAGDFQAGMTSLITGAGESQANLKMVSDGVLNLANVTGTSTKDLTDGMYMIESAGYHGKAGLDVLTAAAEGAKVGSAKLADVANGVTTAMTDYAKSGLTASQATNGLIATVAAGKTHMGDLANAMSTILPTSAAVRVSFTDVEGAMATMTGEGTNAASASTYLRQMLMALESPAKKGATALKDIGLSTTEVSDAMKKSLPDTLQLITDHLKKKFPEGSAAYMAALKDISGGSKQMQGVLELTGDHLKTFSSNVSGISDAMKKGGSAITGWGDVTADFNTKMDRAREVVETTGIKIGTILLPMVGSLVDMFSSQVGPAVQFVSDVFGEVKNAFVQVATPIQQVHMAMQPLLDTFDRASGYIKKTEQAAQPLLDTFDRAKGILTTTHQAAQPLLDTFDRAHSMVDRANASFKQVTQTMSPLQEAAKHVGDIIASIVVPAVHDFIDIIHSPQVATFMHQLQDLGAAIVSGVGPAFSNMKPKVDAVFNFIKTVAIPALGNLIEAIARTTQFLKDHAGQIQTVGVILGMLYVPAVIKAGIESAMAGIKIAIQFVANIIKVGVEGLVAVGKLTMFVVQMVASGAQAVIAGGKIAASFIANIVKAGFEAVLAGAKVVGSFVASLVTTAAQAIATGAVIAARFVVTLVQAAAQAVVTGATFMATLIPALVSMAAEAIVAAVTAIPALIVGLVAWAVGAWTVAAAMIAATWPILLIIAVIALLVIGIYLLVTHWKQVIAFLQTAWKNFTAWLEGSLTAMRVIFQTIFTAVKAEVSRAWESIIGFFKNAWGGIGSALNSLGAKVTNWFSDLKKSALKWGEDMIQNFINGINGMLGNLGNVAQNVGGTIAKFLHFSKPDAGPLASVDTWMPDFTNMLASGLNAGVPQIAGAASNVAQSIAQMKQYPIHPVVASSASSTSGSHGNLTVHLEIDGQHMAQVVMPHVDGMVRAKFGPRARSV